jgi:hypothetical protein
MTDSRPRPKMTHRSGRCCSRLQRWQHTERSGTPWFGLHSKAHACVSRCQIRAPISPPTVPRAPAWLPSPACRAPTAPSSTPANPIYSTAPRCRLPDQKFPFDATDLHRRAGCGSPPLWVRLTFQGVRRSGAGRQRLEVLPCRSVGGAPGGQRCRIVTFWWSIGRRAAMTYKLYF